MKKEKTTTAILLAGGSGERFNPRLAKYLIQFKNKSIIEYTLEAFYKSQWIDHILVVTRSQDFKFISTLLLKLDKKFENKGLKIKEGGKTRADSVWQGLSFLKQYYGYSQDHQILIHDVARPLVSLNAIQQLVHALNEYRACGMGIPVTDTILRLTPNTVVETVFFRDYLIQVQTPQAFAFQDLIEAYQQVITTSRGNISLKFSDDLGIFQFAYPQVPIGFVLGDIKNKKLTYPEDIPFFESYLGKSQKLPK